MSYRDASLALAEAMVRAQVEAHDPVEARKPASPGYTITISREVGALGTTVGAEVGRRLGWAVYDRNLLDQVAEQLQRPPIVLEGIDERPTNWLTEALAGLFVKYAVGADRYLQHLFTVIRGLGQTGRCVIVGRGANFLLSPDTTVRVRLVAEPADRARVVARRDGCTPEQAAARVKATERDRLAFVKRTFGKDVADPHHYDVVLNMSRLTAEEAADIVVEFVRRRGGPRATSPAHKPEWVEQAVS